MQGEKLARAEKEARRLETVRRFLGDQIAMLESIPHRTPQQEDKLSTLRMERDFQIRAQEHLAEESDEERRDIKETENRISQEEKINDIKAMYSPRPVEDGRQNHVFREQNNTNHVQHPRIPDNTRVLQDSRSRDEPIEHLRNNLGGSDNTPGNRRELDTKNIETPKMAEVKRAEELKRKELELSMAQKTEELIVREAQKGQEIARLSFHETPPGSDASHRLDDLIGPTESSDPGPRDSTKKVQFSDAESTPKQDPDMFIAEAQQMMSHSVSPRSPTGTTPGVIGAQEVYRDPRQKRLNEQAERLAASKGPAVPEKLTFREKMKMFAMEEKQ